MNCHIASIVPVRPVGSADPFTFRVILFTGVPGHAAQIHVPAPTLATYGGLQLAILETTGLLWRHEACEGRDGPHQDESWGHILAVLLKPPELAEPDPQPQAQDLN